MANLLNWRRNIPISKGQQHNPLMRIQTALDKAMEDFSRAFEWHSYPSKEFENLVISPAIDIVDEKDHFKIEAEMPGMGEDDIEVSINNGILTIRGEKETSKQDKDKNYFLREISYGSYERNIQLPDSVDVDKAKASFKKGMLWVDIPKKPEAVKQSRKIAVEKVK